MSSSDFSLQPDQPKPLRQDYQKDYWQKYKRQYRQVVGTLTHDEYEQVERRARRFNRGVWTQIWLESCAYDQQHSIPIPAVEKLLREVKVELRRIGNNINQIAAKNNTMARLLEERQLLRELQVLEAALEQSVKTIHKLQ